VLRSTPLYHSALNETLHVNVTSNVLALGKDEKKHATLSIAQLLLLIDNWRLACSRCPQPHADVATQTDF